MNNYHNLTKYFIEYGSDLSYVENILDKDKYDEAMESYLYGPLYKEQLRIARSEYEVYLEEVK